MRLKTCSALLIGLLLTTFVSADAAELKVVVGGFAPSPPVVFGPEDSTTDLSSGSFVEASVSNANYDAYASAEAVTDLGIGLKTLEINFQNIAHPTGAGAGSGSRAFWTDTITVDGMSGDIDLVFQLEGTVTGTGSWQFFQGEPVAGEIPEIAPAPGLPYTFTQTVTLGDEFELGFESRVIAGFGGSIDADFRDTITLMNIYESGTTTTLANPVFDSGLTFAAVPEPGSFLALSVVAGFVGFRRRRPKNVTA